MHEAGHAVSQLATGPAPWIDYIEVGSGDTDQLGIVFTRSMWQPAWIATGRASPDIMEDWRCLADRDVVNFLAGPIAELRWRRHCRAAIWLGAWEMAERCLGEEAPGDRTDFGQVRRRLLWTHPGREREAFNEAWLRTEEIVARWWREIRLLGRELDAEGRIEGGDLLDLWAVLRDGRRAAQG